MQTYTSSNQTYSDFLFPGQFLNDEDLVSLLPPEYTPDLAFGEKIIDYTPSGTYTESSSGITLILANQEDNAEQPTYGLNAPVIGSVKVPHDGNISEVALKVIICCL